MGFRGVVSDWDVSLALWARKVDIGLPAKGNSNCHGARPVHQTISMMKWIRTSRLSIMNPLSRGKVDLSTYPLLILM